MKPIDKLAMAMDKFEVAEEKKEAAWVKEETNPDDEFQAEIKATAKTLLKAIKVSASSAYGLEATELARLTKAVVELQTGFFGKEDKVGTTIIQTNQLAMFKGML